MGFIEIVAGRLLRLTRYVIGYPNLKLNVPHRSTDIVAGGWFGSCKLSYLHIRRWANGMGPTRRMKHGVTRQINPLTVHSVSFFQFFMLKLLRVFLTCFLFASGTCSCIGLHLFLNMRNVTPRCLVKRWNLPLVKRWCLAWMSPGGGCHCSVVGILLMLFRYSWGIFFPEWIHMHQQRWSDQSI